MGYGDFVAATLGLLTDAVRLTRPFGLKYAVVGGWSPYFLNSRPIRHPGSRDVDLLFADAHAEGALAEVIKAFLAAGYSLSAKHEFQLLRILRVAGTDFVFNIDLLHPGESGRPEMFADHLQLPIPSAEFRSEQFAAKSIVLPQARFIFDGHIVQQAVEALLPSGEVVNDEFPLMNEVGLIATKAESCRNKKRPRDAFDIFLAISQVRDPSSMVKDWQALETKDRAVYNLLFQVRESVQSQSFVDNVRRYMPFDTPLGDPEIRKPIEKFFDAVGLQGQAEPA